LKKFIQIILTPEEPPAFLPSSHTPHPIPQSRPKTSRIFQKIPFIIKAHDQLHPILVCQRGPGDTERETVFPGPAAGDVHRILPEKSEPQPEGWQESGGLSGHETLSPSGHRHSRWKKSKWQISFRPQTSRVLPALLQPQSQTWRRTGTLIQSVITGNPFACVAYMTAGENHPAVEKTRESYTAKFFYQNDDAKSVGTTSEKYNTLAGYNAGITAVLAATPNITAHTGTIVMTARTTRSRRT